MQHSRLLSIAILKSVVVPASQGFAIKPDIPRQVRLKAAQLDMSDPIDCNDGIVCRSTLQLSSAMGGDEYCQVVDEFGCQALESHIASTGDIAERWVRLQATPDFPSMTQGEILQRIKDVERQQAAFGRSDLYPREWIPKGANGHDPQRSFSVLQFNILAEGLSFGPNTQSPFEPTQKLQEYKAKNSYGGFTSVAHPDICLDFELRQWRLLQAILDADCDIVCLEEMDRFYGFFLPMLAKFGYEGYFIPKLHSPGVKLGWYSDGCAIFYRSSIFVLDRLDRHLYRVGNQVCLVARLDHRQTGNKVQIVATHLKAQQNAECEVMRKQQVHQLLEVVSQNSDVPTIVAGDFNTDPLTESVQLIRNASFISAHDLGDPNLVTTWKTRGRETKKRIIDYLFFTATTLQCMALLSIPHDEIEEQLLPSLRYPSDHVLLAAKFQFK